MTIDEQRFKALISGELDDAEATELVRQLEADEQGCGLLELHEVLRRGATVVPEPGDAEFDAMRGRVLEQLHGRPGQLSPPAPRGVTVSRALLAVAATLTATLLLVVGFLTGRALTAQPRAPQQVSWPERIELAAMSHRDLQDVDDSPYRFSDVQVRSLQDGRLALAFNVTTHVEFIRHRNDPLVTEVLVQSMVPSSSLPNRLRALEYAAPGADPRLCDALVRSMLYDPELPVRLAALSQLTPLDFDPRVQQALLQVLERDESVQMRLLAIDHLSPERLQPEFLNEILTTIPENQVRPLEIRAGARLASL